MSCIVCVDESGNLTANNLSGTNTGDQTITLTGDVTGSGTGSFATTIANDAVTYAKMQDVSAASKLLGRGAASGSGNVEEITLGTGLAMSGTTLSVPGLGDTWQFVTSQEASSSSTIDFTGLASSYDYIFTFSNVNQSGAGQMNVLFGAGGSPTWRTSNYAFTKFGYTTGGSSIGDGSSGETHISISGSLGATAEASGSMTLYNPGRNAVHGLSFESLGIDNPSGNYAAVRGGATRTTAEAVTALRIKPDDGQTFTSGLFTLYRRRNQ